MIGDKILEQAATEGHRLTGLEETKVLEKVGHACQRSFGEPRRDRLARLPILLVYDGIDDRIDLFAPCDRSLQHLISADLALGDEPGEGDGVVLPIFIEPHGPQISELEPMENDYSYSDLTTSFMISVMLAQIRCSRGDDVSPQACYARKQEAMQVSKAGHERPARASPIYARAKNIGKA